jgi:hypothetical protein
MGTGRITFYRERPRQDIRRSYRILVDGGEIGTLQHGGSLSVDLPEGPHTGQARIGGTGSSEQSFDVLADVETRVCVCPTPHKRLDAVRNMQRSMSEAGWLILVPDGTKRPSSVRSFHLGWTAASWAAFVLYLVVLKATTSIPVRITALVILGVPIVFVAVRTLRGFRAALRTGEEASKRDPKPW